MYLIILAIHIPIKLIL